MRLADKVAVITGAGQGIGRAAALQMSTEGAAVVVSDVGEASGQETTNLIENRGGKAVFVKADVSKSDEVEQLMGAAVDHFGGLDILHNNAGVHETDLAEDPRSFAIDEASWSRVIDVNLKGPWLCTKSAVPHMRERGGGSIINASSIGGLTAFPMASAYCSSKAGLILQTKVFALELAAFGIRVNAYAPGTIHTPMLDKYFDAAGADGADELRAQLLGPNLIPRLGTPEDVAELVVYLASDAAGYITGECITIDGGATAWRGSNA